MSRMWLICCDRCGRESTPAATRQVVIDRARKDGWHLRGHSANSDVCPDCWAAGPG